MLAKYVGYGMVACDGLWNTFDELENSEASTDKRVVSTARTYLGKVLDEIKKDELLESLNGISDDPDIVGADEVLAVDQDFFYLYFIAVHALNKALKRFDKRGLKAARTKLLKRVKVHLEDAGFDPEDINFENLEVR